jgi:hypothetical protein
MTLHDYLRTHASESMPAWLAQHRLGDRFDRKEFFGSHVVFYPGSATDGHPVALFGSTHSAHTFVYTDYGVSAKHVRQELAPTGHPFSGYHTLDRIELQIQDLVPHGWTPHAGAQPYGHQPMRPYGFVEILERDNDRDDRHGPKRLAILFLGADGIATYDALFCQENQIPTPMAVVLEDYGFGGQYRGGQFGSGGLFEKLATTCQSIPRFLLVAENTESWKNFVRIDGIEGD